VVEVLQREAEHSIAGKPLQNSEEALLDTRAVLVGRDETWRLRRGADVCESSPDGRDHEREVVRAPTGDPRQLVVGHS
jgi:hypothetical protein